MAVYTDLKKKGTSVVVYPNIQEQNIPTGAVTTAKIGDAQVTTAKIVDSSITTAKIADSSITTAKLGNASVTTAKIGDGAITSAKISGGAITETRIASLAVTTAKLGNASVTSSKVKWDYGILGDLVMYSSFSDVADALHMLFQKTGFRMYWDVTNAYFGAVDLIVDEVNDSIYFTDPFLGTRVTIDGGDQDELDHFVEDIAPCIKYEYITN